ncbi:hypothetical protein CRYUN_Cryun38cG0034700 [Craigia yunnanensis]
MLAGTIPPEIGNLQSLQFLNLVNNSFTGSIPPSIFNISTLRSIALMYNRFSGQLPSTTGLGLPILEELHLAVNELSGPIPTSISNASELIIIQLLNNSFSGFIPDTIGNLRYLKILDLSHNNLSSKPSSPELSFLPSLTNCKHLERLIFDDNPLISGELPISVGNLSASLTLFYASLCNIKGNIPSEIGNLSKLLWLGLDHNDFTGTIPPTIGRLRELQNVNLGNNKLEGSIPFEICHLKKLTYLTLTGNKLSGPIPACLGDVVSLRNLFLGSNNFSSIPSTLTRLDDILFLELSSNSLSGSLPIDIGKWKSVTNLNLSENQFTGTIPSSIADLTDLTHLSLSGNMLQGFIPQSFDELISLEYLDLSRNSLSGMIPKSLEKLSYLKYLNVSFNRLQGEIPNGGSFANYSSQSFMGNEALCGSSQFQVPPCKTGPSRRSKSTEILKYILPATGSAILILAMVIILLRSRNRKAEVPFQENLLPIAEWRRISYYELDQATDGFSESNLLGVGSFGSVYQGTLSDSKSIAVKVFNANLDRALRSFHVECDVLCNIRHRNLVKIISSCSNIEFKALVLEFMPNGSLEKWLYSHNHFLDVSQRMNIMIDIALALEYLHHGHTPPVVHCDLKPNNVLLDEDMIAHLGDFGIAKLLDEEDLMIQTMTLATIGYMSPEYGSEGIVSTKGDVYSFGILLMETFIRKKPTDDMFAEEMSLKCWVKKSLSSKVVHVVDANLLNTGVRERLAAMDCVLSILQLALECSTELPEERIDMKEVVARLKKTKIMFLREISIDILDTLIVGMQRDCSSSSTCFYGVTYSNTTFSVGFLAKETLTTTSSYVFKGFLFGCGQRNCFPNGGRAAGVLGLGRGWFALVSQTVNKYKKVFSYCLPSSDESSGYLEFGSANLPSSIKYTPMSKSFDGTHYYGLDMIDISVGGEKLSIDRSVFSASGTVIDSASLITRLPPAAYGRVRNAFEAKMTKYPKAPAFENLGTCYDFSGNATVVMPTISLYFNGGVEMPIDARGILYFNKISQACLAFAKNGDDKDVMILGNFQQKGYEVVYDDANGRVGFATGRCS